MVTTKGAHMNKNASKEINIKDFFSVIRKRFWLVVLIIILASLGGYYISNSNNTPLYETSTRVLISPDQGDMNTLMVIVKDPLILEKVKQDLNLSRSIGKIADQMEITRLDDSQVILITVTDEDPKLAASIANQTAAIYKEEVGNLLEFNEVFLLSEAKKGTVPVTENSQRILWFSLIFGVITGIGLALLLDSFDSTVREEAEVEGILGVPVIGVVSKMSGRGLSRRKTEQSEVIKGGVVDLK